MLIESKRITNEEVEIYRSSRYQVISIIPSDQNPTLNVYVLNQEELEHFLRTHRRYAEFVISVSQVEAVA